MARVKKEILDKIEKYLDELDNTIEGKCTLCNETLTHVTNQCSAQTGAPKNTITTIITKRFNASALPADKLGKAALRDRVKRNEGIKEADRLLKKEKTAIQDSSVHMEVEVEIDLESYLPIISCLDRQGINREHTYNIIVSDFNSNNEDVQITPIIVSNVFDNKYVELDDTTITLLKQENEELKCKVAELTKIIVDYVDVEANVAEEVKQAKEGTVKREVAVDFILKEGNQIQCTMMKTQNPDNARLFKLFVAVRNRYLEVNPPQSLPEVIRNATRIEL